MYWPTIDDFRVIISQYDITNPFTYDLLLRRYPQYAAVYVARECVDSRDRSFAGFRSFVETFDYDTVGRAAENLSNEIITFIEQRIALGLAPAEEGCMLYVFPATWDEALLTVHLHGINLGNPFYDAIIAGLEQKAHKCILRLVDDEEQIFIRCMWPPNPE